MGLFNKLITYWRFLNETNEGIDESACPMEFIV